MTEENHRLKPYKVYNPVKEEQTGGKKILKKVKGTRKSRKVHRRKKIKTSSGTRKSRKVHRRKSRNSRKSRRIHRRKSRNSKRSRKHGLRFRGGSGAASSWARNFSSGGTAFCPDGKVEVPYIPTAGVEKAGPIGINDINKSLTAVAAQSNANRKFDNLSGK